MSEFITELNLESAIEFTIAFVLVLAVLEILALMEFGGAAYPTGIFNNASSWAMNPPPLPWTL